MPSALAISVWASGKSNVPPRIAGMAGIDPDSDTTPGTARIEARITTMAMKTPP